MSIRTLACLASLGLASAAAAQALVRPLPEDARRGVLSHVRENVVLLDGREARLAPGAQIRGANNLIVLPVSLPKASLVKYQLDANGQLARVWILTAEEAARPDRPSRGADAGRASGEPATPERKR